MRTSILIPHKGDNHIVLTFEKRQELIIRFKKLNDTKRSATCATHMLKNRIDLRFIQELLADNSSKTNETNTRISTKILQKTESRLTIYNEKIT